MQCFALFKPTLRQQFQGLHDQPVQVLDIKGVKPMRALEVLRQTIQNCPDRAAAWLHDARVAAIMGSCLRSRNSFNSGCRHWIKFIEIMYGVQNVELHAMPPKMSDVLVWTNTFQCVGTFCNYLSYLRGACHALGFVAPPTGDAGLRRACNAIAKRELWEPRPKMFIDRTMAVSLLIFCFL